MSEVEQLQRENFQLRADYERHAAPVLAIAPTPDRNRFLREIIEIVNEAAQECDVELR